MKRPAPRNTRHRATEPKRAAARHQAVPEPEPPRTRHHPLFGDVPLLPVAYVDYQGRQRTTFDVDPDYQPPLPKGAVRGDIRRQEFCHMCHMPHYFYVDIPCSCVQCGRVFVFRAAEQKHWYETLKFHSRARAVRCLSCRRKRRSEHALLQEIGEQRARLRANPNDPAALLALAEALVRCFERTERGPLTDAIAASRKARRLLKDHPARELSETLFWEGRAHALAGRADQARELLAQFLDARGGGRSHTLLAKEARVWLEGARAVPVK